ncbi:MAG: glia maturation factor [archaeon]|nr:glia maturation factor [archaeon]
MTTAFNKWKRQKDPGNCAFILKINRVELTVELEEELTDTSIDDIAAELPESAPRYVIYSYRCIHSDGRKSYPLVFLYYIPDGCNPELNMLYSSTKVDLSTKLNIQKEFEVRDAEDLTEKWLKDKLAVFG